jgi:hypothetical protein
MKKIIISALLMASLSGVAHAASSADILLGFRAAGGTGATTNLEVDLGSISTLKSVVGTVTLTNLLSTGPDGANGINSIYGSSWATRSDLFWGSTGTVFGSAGPDGELVKTVFGTAQAPSSTLDGTSTTTPWTEFSSTGASAPSAQIQQLYNQFGVFGTVVGSSYQTANNTTGSWSVQEPGGGAIAFKAFNPESTFENTTNITGAFVASDLYELDPGHVGSPSTFLGTLSIFANGNVDFSTPVAIPEPSVYAAILGAACLGFVAIRRRKQQVIA